jgi:hypothetical protein
MIVLQSRLSGMFFKDFGYWVAQVAEAVQFESRERAWRFIHDQHVADVALRELPVNTAAALSQIQH